MSWTQLTTDHLASQLSGRELELLRDAHREPGQPDPVAEVLARVIAEVRGYIPHLRSDATLAAGLVPDALHGAALDIARWRLCSRLASGRQAAEWLLTEPRKLAWESAEKYLRDVARGLIAVEPPPVGAPPAPAPQDDGDYGSTAWDQWD